MSIFEVTYKAVCPSCGHHWKSTVRRQAADKIEAGRPTPPMQCEDCKAFTVPYRIVVGSPREATAADR